MTSTIASNIAEELYELAKECHKLYSLHGPVPMPSFGIEATAASSSFPFLPAQKIKLPTCHNLLQLLKDSCQKLLK